HAARPSDARLLSAIFACRHVVLRLAMLGDVVAGADDVAAGRLAAVYRIGPAASHQPACCPADGSEVALDVALDFLKRLARRVVSGLHSEADDVAAGHAGTQRAGRDAQDFGITPVAQRDDAV